MVDRRLQDKPGDEQQGEPAVLRAAGEYIRRGWVVVPLRPGTKKPFDNDWPVEGPKLRILPGKRLGSGSVWAAGELSSRETATHRASPEPPAG